MPTTKRLRSIRCPHKREIQREPMGPYAGKTGVCICCWNGFGYPSFGPGEPELLYCPPCGGNMGVGTLSSVHAETAVACLNPLRPLPADEAPETPQQPSMPYVAVSYRDIESDDTLR